MVRAVIYEELAEQSGVSVSDPLDALTLAVAALATGPFPLPLLEATQALPALGSRYPSVVDLSDWDSPEDSVYDLEAFGTGATQALPALGSSAGIEDTQVLPVVRLEAMPPEDTHAHGWGPA